MAGTGTEALGHHLHLHLHLEQQPEHELTELAARPRRAAAVDEAGRRLPESAFAGVRAGLCRVSGPTDDHRVSRLPPTPAPAPATHYARAGYGPGADSDPDPEPAEERALEHAARGGAAHVEEQEEEEEEAVELELIERDRSRAVRRTLHSNGRSRLLLCAVALLVGLVLLELSYSSGTHY